MDFLPNEEPNIRKNSVENTPIPGDLNKHLDADDGERQRDVLRKFGERGKLKIIWPPSREMPKKTFLLEEELNMSKPRWPPETTAPTSAECRSGSLMEHIKTLENKGQQQDSISFPQPYLQSIPMYQKEGVTGIKEKEMCEARKDEREGNKTVHEKLNDTEDAKSWRKSETDLNANNSVVVQGAEREKNENTNEPDGAEFLQVASTEDEVVPQNHKENLNKNNNNNNYVAASSLNNCRQKPATLEFSNLLPLSSEANYTASEYQIGNLENASRISELLGIFESEKTYSRNVLAVALNEQMARAPVQSAPKSGLSGGLIVKAKSSIASSDTSILNIKGNHSNNKSLHFFFSNTVKIAAFSKKNEDIFEPDLIDPVDQIKNMPCLYLRELEDIKRWKRDGAIGATHVSGSASFHAPRSGCAAAPTSPQAGAPREQLTVEEQIKRNRCYSDTE